jgi:hypothetical protein
MYNDRDRVQNIVIDRGPSTTCYTVLLCVSASGQPKNAERDWIVTTVSIFLPPHHQCCQVLSRLLRHFNNNTPLFGKNSSLIHILKNFATFPLFHVIFCKLIFEKKQNFFLISKVLPCLLVQISSKWNSAIFALLLDKLIAVPLSRFRRFKHSFSARFEQNSGVHRYMATLPTIQPIYFISLLMCPSL